MNPTKQGSFATADQISKLQAGAKKAPPPKVASEEPVVEKTLEELDAVAEFKKAKKANEDAIGITITDGDITDYIFRGRIAKNNIIAIKGKVKVTFQSLTPKEIAAVDQFIANARENGKHTLEGIGNLRTIEQMSYAWLEINDKPLPKDLEKRKEAINQMGTHIVNRVVESFRCFDILIEMTLREEEFLKK